MGDNYRDRIQDGLKKIQKVLDYSSDNHQTRVNTLIWTKNSIDALLQGEWVEMPPRIHHQINLDQRKNNE